MNSFKKVLIPLLCVLAIAITACSPSADTKEASAVDKQQNVYNDAQPAPFFDWSLQRDLWVQYYKLQNESRSTWSYVTEMGELKFECPSIGFPIPAGTQLTNPAKYVYNGATLPQAEANGLYSVPSLATIIFCLNDDGTVSPFYAEGQAYASPFPSKWDENLRRIVRIPGESTMKANVGKPGSLPPVAPPNQIPSATLEPGK